MFNAACDRSRFSAVRILARRLYAAPIYFFISFDLNAFLICSAIGLKIDLWKLSEVIAWAVFRQRKIHRETNGALSAKFFVTKETTNDSITKVLFRRKHILRIVDTVASFVRSPFYRTSGCAALRWHWTCFCLHRCKTLMRILCIRNIQTRRTELPFDASCFNSLCEPCAQCAPHRTNERPTRFGSYIETSCFFCFSFFFIVPICTLIWPTQAFYFLRWM